MTYIFTILFSFFLVTSIFPQAVWRVMNPHPSANLTHMGAAVSADKYAVVSSQGEVIMTTNGGAEWDIIPINTTRILRAMFFINNNVGWIGGASDALFKTTDGGFTWTHVTNAPDTIKYDIYFLNENVGWGTGFRGFIMKTTDGGVSWFSQSITHLTTSTMYGIYAYDANNVFAAGNASSFYRSTDGGDSWSLIPNPFTASTDLREVKFTSSSNGFVIGTGTRIARTTDGGATWAQVHSGASVQLWSMGFNSSGTTGVVVGASSTVLRTTDGGSTWTPAAGFPTGITFYSARFATDNIVYISGSNGHYYKSTDAGATWVPLHYRFTSTRIRDVSFANLDTGWVVGTTFIAKTTDGGFTWTEQTSPFTGDINEVVAVNSQLVIAGADGGNVVRTSDGGATWTTIPTGISGTNSDILAIDFVNENFGIVAAYNGNVATTTNGGLTWNIVGLITGSNPWDMDMVTETHGWVSGTGERIFRTTDGGATWTQQLSVGGLGTYGISFMDTLNGVAGGTGGNTYYTTDGGDTWSPAITKPGQTVWGIHMEPSPVHGSVAATACASGYVYISKDGGRNWFLEPRFTISTMDDVFMTDAANAWFVGNSGAIIKYTDWSNIPVELSSFTASVSGNDVTLSWGTATELNNAGFDVERFSEKYSDWEKIGYVEGNGTTTEVKNYSYTDKNLIPGRYEYRIKQIDFDGTYKYYNLPESVEVGIPSVYSLQQNFPNPFNPSTTIRYSLPQAGMVSLKIYDALGKEVKTLLNEDKEAGYHQITFDAGNLASGIYFYTLKAGNFVSTKKLTLMK
jgi:photosystem II stability/assembly factor-like uncharacterized protein